MSTLDAAQAAELLYREAAMLDRLVEAYSDVCPADIEHVLTQLSRQPGAISLLQSALPFGDAEDFVSRAFG